MMFSKTLKKGELALALLFVFLSSLSANLPTHNPYILEGNLIVDPRASQKLFQIGSEVESKTGIPIYIYTKLEYGIDKSLTSKEKVDAIKKTDSDTLKRLKAPYVLITLSFQDKHVYLYASKDVEQLIDKDEILQEYMIPILASYDKNTIGAKITASLFNGYSEVADQIAEAKGIKLESNIESSNKTMADIWKIIMYFIVISGLLAYFIAIRRQKKLGIS
jgi:hypothetical protein